jgi:hypothetical protein
VGPIFYLLVFTEKNLVSLGETHDKKDKYIFSGSAIVDTVGTYSIGLWIIRMFSDHSYSSRSLFNHRLLLLPITLYLLFFKNIFLRIRLL